MVRMMHAARAAVPSRAALVHVLPQLRRAHSALASPLSRAASHPGGGSVVTVRSNASGFREGFLDCLAEAGGDPVRALAPPQTIGATAQRGNDSVAAPGGRQPWQHCAKLYLCFAHGHANLGMELQSGAYRRYPRATRAQATAAPAAGASGDGSPPGLSVPTPAGVAAGAPYRRIKAAGASARVFSAPAAPGTTITCADPHDDVQAPAQAPAWRGLQQLDGPLLGCSAGSFVYNARSSMRPFVSLTAITLPQLPGVRLEPFVCVGSHLPQLRSWPDLVKANSSHFFLVGRPSAAGESQDELQALVSRLGSLFPDAMIAAGRALPPARLGLPSPTAASDRHSALLFANFAPLAAPATSMGIAVHGLGRGQADELLSTAIAR
jgi:hypothetical protein